jgi:hypothetical protein
MLPPTLVRRFALVPLVVVIAACLVALTPLVALASLASALVRRWTGHGHRSRPLRVAWLALVRRRDGGAHRAALPVDRERVRRAA